MKRNIRFSMNNKKNSVIDEIHLKGKSESNKSNESNESNESSKKNLLIKNKYNKYIYNICIIFVLSFVISLSMLFQGGNIAPCFFDGNVKAGDNQGNQGNQDSQDNQGKLMNVSLYTLSFNMYNEIGEDEENMSSETSSGDENSQEESQPDESETSGYESSTQSSEDSAGGGSEESSPDSGGHSGGSAVSAPESAGHESNIHSGESRSDHSYLSSKSSISSISSISGVSTSDTTSTSTPGPTIPQKSTNTNLEYLRPDEGVLSPAFDPRISVYYVSLPHNITHFDADIKTSDPKAGIIDKSRIPLSVGKNSYTFKVIAEDNKTTRQYRIEVTRAMDPDDPNYGLPSIATLSELKPESGSLSPLFSPDIFNYSVSLPHDADTFFANIKLTDPLSTIIKNDRINLNDGENIYEIVIQAQNGMRNIYMLTVQRDEKPGEKNSSADLISDIEDSNFTFSVILLDSRGKPMKNISVELYPSEVNTETDKNGCFAFGNMEEGEYTLFFGRSSGPGLGSLFLNISKGDLTIYKDGNLMVNGDTILTLQIRDECVKVLSVINGKYPGKGSRAENDGGWVLWVIIFLIASAALAFYFLRNTRIPFLEQIKKRITGGRYSSAYYEDTDDDSKIIM